MVIVWYGGESLFIGGNKKKRKLEKGRWKDNDKWSVIIINNNYNNIL